MQVPTLPVEDSGPVVPRVYVEPASWGMWRGASWRPTACRARPCSGSKAELRPVQILFDFGTKEMDTQRTTPSSPSRTQ